MRRAPYWLTPNNQSQSSTYRVIITQKTARNSNLVHLSHQPRLYSNLYSCMFSNLNILNGLVFPFQHYLGCTWYEIFHFIFLQQLFLLFFALMFLRLMFIYFVVCVSKLFLCIVYLALYLLFRNDERVVRFYDERNFLPRLLFLVFFHDFHLDFIFIKIPIFLICNINIYFISFHSIHLIFLIFSRPWPIFFLIILVISCTIVMSLLYLFISIAISYIRWKKSDPNYSETDRRIWDAYGTLQNTFQLSMLPDKPDFRPK